MNSRAGVAGDRPSQLPAPPPRPQPLRGADLSRERLLQAAHELLVENAGAEPSVSQICGRASMQVGMVSYCFGGKAALLDALIVRAMGEIAGETERLRAADLPPTEKLRRHVRDMVRNFVRYPYVQTVSEQTAAGSAIVQPMIELYVSPSLDFFAELVADGVAAGEFRDGIDPKLLFFSTVGTCQFVFVAKSWIAAAGETMGEALIERYVQHCTQMVLRAVVQPGTLG